MWFSQIKYFISEYQRLCKQLPKSVKLKLKLQKLYSICHVWWMWIRIMARNDHQRESVSTPINNFQYFFAYFICGVELPALWMNCHWGNIRFARITLLSMDFWYIHFVIFSSTLEVLYSVDIMDVAQENEKWAKWATLARVAHSAHYFLSLFQFLSDVQHIHTVLNPPPLL